MTNRRILILLLFLWLPSAVLAQYYGPLTKYRPSGLDWQQIKTEHFRIIFPNGEDSLAFRAAAILENQYPLASKRTGGTLTNFPVILNNYNDLSNGFVTSLNFRSEIELPPIKGKGMNPQSGDWLENVLPHELVHATHFNVQLPGQGKKISLPGFISFLSPDLARSIHAFAPVGMHEGLAVYHESNSVAPNGGRGNYTYFNNQFNANFGSPHRWNMGQTLIPSEYTLPYDRHYISGYTFIDWLHEKYGEDVSKNAIRMHYSHFFLGYGYALKHVTGKWPGVLYREYVTGLQQRENERLSEIEINTTEKSRIIDVPFKGEQIRRPKWVSENELLFYGNFYNGRIGFYTYNLSSDSFELLKETFSVGDNNYEINTSTNHLIYSSYKRDPLYPGMYIMDVHQLNVQNGEEVSLTNNKRVYAPAGNGSKTLALQTFGASARIVEILENGDLRVVKQFDGAIPVALKFNPQNPNQLAVLVNRRETQALWITSFSDLNTDLDKAPDLVFKNISIHDPEWHPTENKIMFTLDAEPAMNVYEYDLQTGEVIQLTSSLYNAYEASYSPDGNSIAYIFQQENEQKMGVLNRSDFLGQTLSSEFLLKGEELEEALSKPLLGAEILSDTTWEKTPYKPGLSWLRPRMVLPVVRDNSGTRQAGVAISSADVLSSQGYYAEITGIQNRLWYDISYTNKSFFPGFELSGYSEPDFFAIENPDGGRTGIMRQERGFSLGIPFDFTFRGDTRLSSISFTPEIAVEQIKFYDLSPEPISDFTNRYKTGFYSQLNLGVLNLARDIQPSSGLVLFGFLDNTYSTSDSRLNFPNGTVSNISYNNQWSAYYGAFGYVSPLRKFNQSLKLDLKFLQQSKSPVYSTGTIVPMGFSENPFPTYIQNDVNNNLARFSTRYTIPLFYPDKGGLTLPLYVSSIYLTGFSHTLTNLNEGDVVDASRSIFGAGFHVQFKLSNLAFDLGVGIAFEPTRNKSQIIIGQF